MLIALVQLQALDTLDSFYHGIYLFSYYIAKEFVFVYFLCSRFNLRNYFHLSALNYRYHQSDLSGIVVSHVRRVQLPQDSANEGKDRRVRC